MRTKETNITVNNCFLRGLDKESIAILLRLQDNG